MAREHVGHKDLVSFAEKKVNLGRNEARKYREQVGRLREKLRAHIKENPNFALRKMMLSGSLAKGTALRSINDIDVALYVSAADAPQKIDELLQWISSELAGSYSGISSDQIRIQEFSVRISFSGTGLDVDIVPIIYEDDPDWYGYLISQLNGKRLWTCIPRHIEFIQRRKSQNPKHFAQVVRLLKYWARLRKSEVSGFKLKSFLIELILAHLVEKGVTLNSYADAMNSWFNFVVSDELIEIIAFQDYFPRSSVDVPGSRVKVIDPVNPKNNVAKQYDHTSVEVLINECMSAADSIEFALRAISKEETIDAWKRVFGPSFGVA